MHYYTFIIFCFFLFLAENENNLVFVHAENRSVLPVGF